MAFFTDNEVRGGQLSYIYIKRMLRILLGSIVEYTPAKAYNFHGTFVPPCSRLYTYILSYVAIIGLGISLGTHL